MSRSENQNRNVRQLIDGERVRKLYGEKRMSLRAVADELGTTHHLVRKEMLRLGIAPRGDGAKRRYYRVASLKVGEHFLIEIDPWRELPSSGLRKAAHRRRLCFDDCQIA